MYLNCHVAGARDLALIWTRKPRRLTKINSSVALSNDGLQEGLRGDTLSTSTSTATSTEQLTPDP